MRKGFLRLLLGFGLGEYGYAHGLDVHAVTIQIEVCSLSASRKFANAYFVHNDVFLHVVRPIQHHAATPTPDGLSANLLATNVTVLMLVAVYSSRCPRRSIRLRRCHLSRRAEKH